MPRTRSTGKPLKRITMIASVASAARTGTNVWGSIASFAPQGQQPGRAPSPRNRRLARRGARCSFPAGESPARLLQGVDSYGQAIHGTSAGDAGTGIGESRCLQRLPPDRGSPAQGREDELGSSELRTIQNQIDCGPTPSAERNLSLVHHLGALIPSGGILKAEHCRRPRPALPSLEHKSALDRQPGEIGQTALGVRVPRDPETAIHPQTCALMRPAGYGIEGLGAICASDRRCGP